jgi:hypothetical protein
MMKLRSVIICGLGIASGAGVAAASPCDWDGGETSAYRSARPASAYELGFVWARFDAGGTDQLVTAKIVRFATRAWFGRHAYFGGEADFGQLSVDINSPANVLARSDSMTTTNDVTGEIGEARVVLGASAGAGAFTGGAELASGIRYTTFRDDPNQPGGFADTNFVIEARGRLDFQLTRVFTVGAVAGVDLQDRHDVSVGLMLGMRFPQ